MNQFFKKVTLLAALLFAFQGIMALDDARLIRYPHISGDQIVFVYAGDLWTVPATGGDARRLTSHKGLELFPKLSPDGKWIAFISFPPDIEFNSHPSYKRVMLRLMPASGGAPKAIAYLYGGQGTINVPSWSPDSQQISFVSNSGKND